MNKTTKTMTGTRNGKPFSMQVEVTTRGAMSWVRKVGDKPFFGTTGYLNTTRDNDVRSYRGKTLVSNVTFS